MGKVSDYPLKAPVESTDKIFGSDSSGNVKNFDTDDLAAFVSEGTAVPFIEVTGSGDDTGLICTEQWAVGKPGAGKESVFGEGDSYPVQAAYHCDIANTTGMTITGAIDITSILASDTGSTTGLFNGTAPGKYIVIGSDYRFSGVKVKVDTNGTIEPGNVIAEYLEGIDTWTRSYFMATYADYPYTQLGDKLATCSSCSEQWLFGFNPLSLPVPWEKVTLTINGTPIEKYWARFRITDTITLDPVIEQIKHHTNNFQIESDGFTWYSGRSRYSKSIDIDVMGNADKTPTNTSIKIADGITVYREKNTFNNSSNDGIIIEGTIPEGIDTSIPVTLYVDWYPKDDSAGDVELEFDLVVAGDTFTYDGLNTIRELTPVITTVSGNAEEKQTSIFQAITETGIPGDTVYASLHRDATPANTTDTYAGSVVITRVRLVGYFWRP